MIKVIELFAGIGSQTQALKNIGIDHEVVAISEIDKYAVTSYEAIHDEVKKIIVEEIPLFLEFKSIKLGVDVNDPHRTI